MVIGPFIKPPASLTGWRWRTAQPTLTGTYPRLHDIYFWSGIAGDWYFTGCEMRQPSSDGFSYATWRSNWRNLFAGEGVNTAVAKAQNLFRHSRKKPAHDFYSELCRVIIVLFCASGTGIFGAMNEGMTGDPSILIAKSFLDFFTAMICCSLGIAVSVISIPLLIIQLTLAWAAALILPLTTPSMMADFSAVGGLLLLATGLRICGIKMFPVVNMLPALLLAMPLSAAWTAWFA